MIDGVVRQRLANQRLIGTPFGSPAEVVEHLGAVQAQDYSGAKWAIAQRTAGATDADVERLVTEGTILRSHLLRPTWHFVAATDIRWMLELTAPRVKAAMAYYNRKLELTPAVFKRSHTLLAKALEGGKQLTRAELAKVLQRGRIDTSIGQRLGHLMMEAELDAVITSGARRGKQFTYALLDERAPRATRMKRDEALAELATRYFATRAPATAQDFAWWSGLTVADAKRGAEAAACVDPWPAGGAKRSAHLLPNYDEYFIGYKDRSAILERVKDVKPIERSTAPFAHVIEIDGQIVGGWKRTLSSRSVTVETHYLAPPNDAQRRAVAAQARRYGEFLGLPLLLA